MTRILFEKTGNAVWISHLDLMRLFQRAFKRAGLPLKHTQGFNPRPSVSIALPLSVGVESTCELLDFDLDGRKVSNEEIMTLLNNALVSGIRVLSVYDDGKKLKHLTFLDCVVALEYDHGVPEGAEEEITALFQRESVLVEKKNKNGITEQNIIPMIRSVSVVRSDENTIWIQARVCCQNPTLNPMQMATAIDLYLPHLKPNFAVCKREEIFDEDGICFR